MEDLDYNSLMRQKEKEMLELKQLRTVQIQDQLVAKDKLIAEMSEKQAQIEEDFNYNVKLIEERDKELEQLETKAMQMKRQLAQKEEDIANLKADLFSTKGEGKSTKKVSKALERDFKQTKDDLSEQVRSLRWSKEQATRDFESQLANLREQYDAEIQAKETALQTLRSEINMNYDKQQKAREASFISQQGVLEGELQEVRLTNAKLQQEVTQLKASGNESSEQARMFQGKIAELELMHKSELRQGENKTAEASFQVQRLESENAFLLKQNDSMKLENSNHIKLLTQEKTQLETEIRDLRDKHSNEMKRVVEMKDSTFERLQEANINQMKRLQDRTGDLVSENEGLMQELQRMKEQLIHSNRAVDFEKSEMVKEYESNKEEWVRLLKQASNDLKLKEAEITSCKDQFANLDTKSGQKYEELQQIKSANMELQENNHKLKNEIASLSHKHTLEIDDLKMQLKQQRQEFEAKYDRINIKLESAEQDQRNRDKFDNFVSSPNYKTKQSSPLRRLWSEDLGPVTLDESFRKSGGSGKFMSIEAENQELKSRIAEMRFEMEQVMNQVKTNISPAKKSLSVTAEDRLKLEVMKLKKERDQLLDISSNLKAQLHTVDFDKPDETLPLVVPDDDPPVQESPGRPHVARAASPLTTAAATLYRKRLRNRSSERKKPLPKYANFEQIEKQNVNDIKVEAEQVVKGDRPVVRNYNIKD